MTRMDTKRATCDFPWILVATYDRQHEDFSCQATSNIL